MSLIDDHEEHLRVHQEALDRFPDERLRAGMRIDRALRANTKMLWVCTAAIVINSVHLIAQVARYFGWL